VVGVLGGIAADSRCGVLVSDSPGESPVGARTETHPCPDAVAGVLAVYLCGAGLPLWPGTDGLTVREVVEEAYSVAAAAGHIPGPVELGRRHPVLRDGIGLFFGTAAAPGRGICGRG
jgi:hypothetical protein